MEVRSVLLILFAVLAAAVIVFYQYFYKKKVKGYLPYLLGFLRFVVLFSALLLLINPKMVNREYYVEKSNLVLLVDDSESMQTVPDTPSILEFLDRVNTDETLQNRFDIFNYRFGNTVKVSDSSTFTETNTDIANALSQTNQTFLKGKTNVLLLTDGNATLGRDYEYLRFPEQNKIYSLILGDTTAYEDLSVGQVNTNSYAFLKNKFPIEANISYRGEGIVKPTISITLNGRRVYQEVVEFSSRKTTHTIKQNISANSVGLKSIVVQVGALADEKNTNNNQKEVALEVIDEKTDVFLVSNILHPDIGALKNAIESNEQRQVTLYNTKDLNSQLDDGDVFILYQPDASFKKVYEHILKSNAGAWVITGPNTDWNAWNSIQDLYQKENFNQDEAVLPSLNASFSAFGFEDLSVERFPPLKSGLGEIEMRVAHEEMLFQKIKGVILEKSLLSLMEVEKRKEAILFGEGIWRWRAMEYRLNRNFSAFDDFIGKLVLYLSTNDRKDRLEVNYNRILDGTTPLKITASYFDESFVFDANAELQIILKRRNSNFERQAPMLLKGNYFETDLSDLEEGIYDFTITVVGENLLRSGSFKILKNNPELLVQATNYKKLNRLSNKTGGQVFYPKDLDLIIERLSKDNEFTPVQKSRQNIVSLIDFEILLALMVSCLALEWFIRKYNGLI
ncbi:MAG: VWA domain-containing protein [Bacteroidota bacterium]